MKFRGCDHRQVGARLAVGLLFVVAAMLSACLEGRQAGPLSATPSSTGNSSECAVTRPDPSIKPPPAVDADGPGLYGNDALWVALPPDGEAVLVPQDGILGRKFMWWRIVPGRLSVQARRLDADAPPVAGSVPAGYGDGGFQASGVDFGSEGCWEVVGRVSDQSLRFVIRVRAKP